MILTEIHHNSAGRPIRYQIEAGHEKAEYKITVSTIPPTVDAEGKAWLGKDMIRYGEPFEWTDCKYWTYEDILRIQKMLSVAVDRIKELYDDHERLVANAEWMEG